jgi:hypothetical protein
VSGALRRFAQALQVLKNSVVAMPIVLRMLQAGAITVSTPKGAMEPALMTVIQLDGDSITYVSNRLERDFPTPTEQATLLQAHLQRLSGALPQLPSVSAATWILVTAGTAATQVVAFGMDVASGSYLALFGTPHLVALAPLGFRRFAVPLFARVLRGSADWALRRGRRQLRRSFEAHGMAAIRRLK